MTGLVVKTVIICTLKFLKNGVCFVLIWQHHWKMSLSIRRATFAERLSPSDFCRATFAERLSPFLARPLTLTSSSPSLPFLTSRRATFVNNAVLQSVLHWREQWRLSRAEQSDWAMSLPSFLTIRSAVVSATRSAVVSAILSAVVTTIRSAIVLTSSLPSDWGDCLNTKAVKRWPIKQNKTKQNRRHCFHFKSKFFRCLFRRSKSTLRPL